MRVTASRRKSTKPTRSPTPPSPEARPPLQPGHRALHPARSRPERGQLLRLRRQQPGHRDRSRRDVLHRVRHRRGGHRHRGVPCHDRQFAVERRRCRRGGRVGGVESAVNPLAKIGKVTKLANAAQKVYSKFGAGRATKGLATRLAKPGEDLYVGPYSVSSRANRASGLNRSHTPHHAPQDAVSGVSRSRGITINIRRDLHERTTTFRRAPRDLPSRRSHLAADVWELRGLLRGAGYARSTRNRQLQELVRQNRSLWGGGAN